VGLVRPQQKPEVVFLVKLKHSQVQITTLCLAISGRGRTRGSSPAMVVAPLRVSTLQPIRSLTVVDIGIAIVAAVVAICAVASVISVMVPIARVML
jgi:hypothetical protein